MKKISLIALLAVASVGLLFLLTACPGPNGGGSGDITEPSTFTVITSNIGSIKNTTWWYADDDATECDWVNPNPAPSSGSGSGSSGSDPSSGSGSGSSGSDPSGTGGSSGSSTPATPDPVQTTAMYLHITNTMEFYTGTVFYTKKCTDAVNDTWVVDSSAAITYKPSMKGTLAVNSDGKLVTTVTHLYDTDNSYWRKCAVGDGAYGRGLFKADKKVVYRKSSTRLTLQTQAACTETGHTGSTKTTQYYYDKATYNSEMKGSATEKYSITLNYDSGVSLRDGNPSGTGYIVDPTDKVADLADKVSTTNVSFGLKDDKGNVYFKGKLTGNEGINLELQGTKADETFADADTFNFTLVKLNEYTVTITTTTPDGISASSNYGNYLRDKNTISNSGASFNVTATNLDTIASVLTELVEPDQTNGNWAGGTLAYDDYNLKITVKKDGTQIYSGYYDEITKSTTGLTDFITSNLTLNLTQQLESKNGGSDFGGGSYDGPLY